MQKNLDINKTSNDPANRDATALDLLAALKRGPLPAKKVTKQAATGKRGPKRAK